METDIWLDPKEKMVQADTGRHQEETAGNKFIRKDKLGEICSIHLYKAELMEEI